MGETHAHPLPSLPSPPPPQAVEAAELKADRDAICGEIFSDVTGEVDPLARERLGLSRPTLYYTVVAAHLATATPLADALLGVLRKLWGNAYGPPLYALLLHRWLLSHPLAGLPAHRQKHVHVLAVGAQQLFWADVHSEARRFAPLYDWLARAVAFAPASSAPRLDAALPLQSRAGLLAVLAAFLPYYGGPAGFAAGLARMPSPRTTAPPPRSAPHAGGADLVLREAADMLGLMKGEAALLTCLASLRGAAGSAALDTAPAAARLRLQAALYGLTATGGPRYLPDSVRGAAFETLDALYPTGALPRRAVALVARLWASPAAWPRALADVAASALDAGAAALGALARGLRIAAAAPAAAARAAADAAGRLRKLAQR